MEIQNSTVNQIAAENEKDKPLYNLINNLVSVSNTDSSTMVENSQLLDILRLEFDMQIQSQPELDVDIYMNVLKKFLKTWPRWDEFDKLMKENSGNPQLKEKLTIEEYGKLKDYLKRVLEYTQTQMGPIRDKMESKRSKVKIDKPTSNGGELVMEIACSREQLNKLFYRKPHPNTLSIFNVSEEPSQSKISLNEIKLKDVLNWPQVNISVNLPNFEFIRRSSSHFERTLINRKLPQPDTAEPLPGELYISLTCRGRKKHFRKNILISYLAQLIKYINQLPLPNEERRNQLIDLFNEIKNDMTLITNYLTTNCEYQYFLNKYPYVRYLSNNDFNEKEKSSGSIEKLKECINPNDFDLHLEEKISPAVKFEMTKFAVTFTEGKAGRVFDINYSCFQDATSNWLRFECTWCDERYDGFLAIYNIISHLNSQHSCEPDWQCYKCGKTFTMIHLCGNRWNHVC